MPPHLLAQTVDVQQLDAAFQSHGLSGWDWGRAGIILGGSFALALAVRWAVAKAVGRSGGGGFASDLLGRLAAYVIVAAGLVYALSALGVRIGPLLGALGIAGIALAFALKDILENFVAGIILQIRRPFRKGDQIVTGDHEGRVLEVNARSVVIDQPDGTRVIVPSSALITAPIVNLTGAARRRTSLDIGVAYDTDLARATAAVTESARRAEGVLAEPAPEALVREFGDSSIVISLRFWHAPTIHDMWRTRSAVALGVKADLDEAGIEIAFPQRVVWMRDAEQEAEG